MCRVVKIEDKYCVYIYNLQFLKMSELSQFINKTFVICII